MSPYGVRDGQPVPETRSGRARLILRIVGSASLALSVVGLWYHVAYLAADYSHRQNPPYFFRAWYTMASINILLLVGGIVLGIGLIRGKAKWVPTFVVLQVLVVADAFLPGMLWLHPRLGDSIAAASGISGGTGLHFVTLYPIWGSIAAIWAARRIREGTRDVARS